MKKIFGAAVVFAMLGSAGFAQELLDAKTAYKQLFSTNKRAIQVKVIPQGFLSDTDLNALNIVGKNLQYYSVIAVSPSSGIVGSGAAAVSNFHSVEAASVAAIASCNANKGADEAECVIVTQVLPKKYDGWRVFQLNPVATDAFKKYRRGKGFKAFATSDGTGDWGQAVGAGSQEAAGAAAIAACQVKSKAADCTVVSEG